MSTVGDFAAQAVVNTILGSAFPQDSIVGEEDSKDLKDETNRELRSRVVELANVALTEDLALGDNTDWRIGPGRSRSAEDILNAIDRGNYQGGRSGRKFYK